MQKICKICWRQADLGPVAQIHEDPVCDECMEKKCVVCGEAAVTAVLFPDRVLEDPRRVLNATAYSCGSMDCVNKIQTLQRVAEMELTDNNVIKVKAAIAKFMAEVERIKNG